jgi:hypothetical protein
MHQESRVRVASAIAGAAMLFIGTYLHPQQADPNDAVAAFAEYAADQLWVASHLLQLAGFVLIGAAFLLDHDYPKWIGTIAGAGGALTIGAGIVIAHAGFSPLAMMIQMPASLILLVWLPVVGAFCKRVR